MNLDDRTIWHVGVRITRNCGKDAGTIVAANGEVKVKWDSGRTSYYRRKNLANIELETRDRLA